MVNRGLLHFGLGVRLSRLVVIPVAGLLLSQTCWSSDIVLSSNEGTCETFGSIQEALDKAKPGSTIQIPGGIYHERLQFRSSGSSNLPITLEGKPGETVIIDGAVSAFQTAPNTRWTPFEYQGHALYTAEVPFIGESDGSAIGTWISYTNVAGNNGCEKLIAAYGSLNGLVSASRGEGSFRKGSRVYVKLANERNPNEVPLNIGGYESILSTGLCSHLRIRNMELRNAGWCAISIGATSAAGPEGRGDAEKSDSDPKDKAVYSDIEISDVVIRNSFRGLNAGPGRGSRVSISRVVVANGTDASWIWQGGYQPGIGEAAGNNSDSLAPWRGFGMRLVNLLDSEVSDCAVFGQWDGMGVKRSDNVKIDHCTLADLMDDGIELESPDQKNVWFFNNHVYNCFSGISVTSDFPGPIYIFRNIVEVTRPGARTQQQSSYTIKSGEDSLGRQENIKFYHNTFWAADSFNVWEKLRDPAPDRWHGYDFVNNIFYSSKKNYNFRGADREDAGDDNHWEGNVYNIDRPQEPGSVTMEGLGDLFVNVTSPERSVPRDFRLKENGKSLADASDYPIKQGWPDSVKGAGSSRVRGAWDPSMASSDIGAPQDVLREVPWPSDK